MIFSRGIVIESSRKICTLDGTTFHNHINWIGYSDRPGTYIIDHGFFIGSMEDLIVIFSSYTCIPFSISRRKCSRKIFIWIEDFFIRSKNKWIFWGKCLICKRKFHKKARRCRHFFTSSWISDRDFCSIVIITIVRSIVNRHMKNTIPISIDLSGSFCVKFEWSFIITTPETIRKIVITIMFTSIYAIRKWNIFHLRSIVIKRLDDTIDSKIPSI